MSFESSHFRQVLGHFPTGVTIVTGMTDHGPAGVTIGSFTSVSLDPPLVGFLPMESSLSWQAIRPTGKFCVNVLAADHGDLCWKFAKPPETERFNDVRWTAAPSGCPIIDGAVAWIDCTVEDVITMGDHLFVLGRVHDLDKWDGEEPRPLLFFRGKLGEFSQLA